VDFEVSFPKSSDTPIPGNTQDLIKLLRLENSFSMKMVLFDRNGAIKEYHDPIDIIRDFFEVCKQGEGRVKKKITKINLFLFTNWL
jgi:hypothetical protein